MMNFQKLLVQSLLWRGLYFFTLLLVNVFLSRYLQAAGAGWVYYLSNIFSFSIIIVGVSLESGVTYFASGKIIHADKLMWFAAVWSFVVSALVLIAVFIYLFFEGNDSPVSREQFYFFGVCYITGLFLTNCGTALFYAQNNFVLPNFLLTLLNILLAIIIPKRTHVNNIENSSFVLDAYFLTFFLQGLFICIAYIIKNKSLVNFKLPSVADIKKLFRYSAPRASGSSRPTSPRGSDSR